MSGDPTVRELRPRWWPLWLFVAISLLLNVATLPAIEWFDFREFERQIQAFLFFAGVLVGECCFVVVVAGLTKRTWLGAYLSGLGLALAGYIAALCGALLTGEFDRDNVAGMALLPALLLVAASPLHGIRYCFGWRLALEGEPSPPRQPLGLSDIFSLIAVVATVLVLIRVPQVVAESDVGEFWWQVVITSLILFGASLVGLPLVTRLALGKLSPRRKFLWLAILPLVIAGGCFGIFQSLNARGASWSLRLEILPFLLTFFGSAIGVFYLSLLSLSASGLRLVRGKETNRRQQTEGAQQQAAHLRRLTWWRIGAAVAMTMGISVYLANLQQWRAGRDKENALLNSRVEATDGELMIADRIPYYLSLGSRATDDDLAELTICNKLEYLYLHDAKITDAGLAHLRHFPLLHTLSLQNLSVSEDGLVHLGQLPNLEMLEIVKCDVKGTHLAGLPNKRQLTTLNLTRTQFGDEESALLVEFPRLTSLTLDYTRITDRSVAPIGRLKALTSLELVGTDLEAEHFPFLPALEHLDLSRTKVNDKTLSSLARLSELQVLSLRDTKVTNASIPLLARLETLYDLDLSDNLIDDEAIRELGGDASPLSIDLSCTRVTGSGFVNWNVNSPYHDVILDRTLTDDNGIAALTSIGAVADLSLARTAVTDACLGHLAQIVINELDIRGTQITFQGLVTDGLPSVSELRVASGQFTSQQISQLEQQLKITVTIAKP